EGPQFRGGRVRQAEVMVETAIQRRRPDAQVVACTVFSPECREWVVLLFPTVGIACRYLVDGIDLFHLPAVAGHGLYLVIGLTVIDPNGVRVQADQVGRRRSIHHEAVSP